tara:strand:- start:460 stop:654 length:195 start_codon:yes stop_codon:yes gene_type:complete
MITLTFRKMTLEEKAEYHKRVKGIHVKNKKILMGYTKGIRGYKAKPYGKEKIIFKKANSAPPNA